MLLTTIKEVKTYDGDESNELEEDSFEGFDD